MNLPKPPFHRTKNAIRNLDEWFLKHKQHSETSDYDVVDGAIGLIEDDMKDVRLWARQLAEKTEILRAAMVISTVSETHPQMLRLVKKISKELLLVAGETD